MRGWKMAKKSEDKSSTNCWDVLMRIVDAVFNLLSVEKFCAAAFLVLSVSVITVIFKYPNEQLPSLFNKFYKILTNLTGESGILVFVLSILLSVSVIGNIVGSKVYNKEIRRLTQKRKNLIHGYKNKSINRLSVHNSTKFDS